MPVLFHSFGREEGRRLYAAPDGMPYAELTGVSAILWLFVQAYLFVAIESSTLMPYARDPIESH